MVTEEDYQRLLYSLLPRGPAWEGAQAVPDGLAPSLARLHQRADALMQEINPQTTEELIRRYEAVCGLPDACALPGVQTVRQRQQRLDAKINIPGGINDTFYRRQLDALGYPAVSITQFQQQETSPDPEWGENWRYYWQVSIPANASEQWQTCTSACHSAIRSWGDTVVECVISKLCPSHCIVIFVYPQGEQSCTELTPPAHSRTNSARGKMASLTVTRPPAGRQPA